MFVLHTFQVSSQTVKAYVKECCSIVVDTIDKTIVSVYNVFDNIAKSYVKASQRNL